MLQERLIELCNLTAGGTIDEDRVKDIHLHDLIAHMLCICWITGTQDLLIVVEVDAVAIEHEIVDIADTHHIQLQTFGLHQVLLLRADLLQKHTAYGTDTTDEEVEHLVFREEERVVQHVQRLAQEPAIDHKRDIRLGSTLGTGNHRDTATA